MISYKIKNLFHFIGYLHSNIENFKQYDNVLNELKLQDIERQKVTLKKTFKDKLKYDDIQAEINANFKIIKENILQPIRARVNELNICDMNKTGTLWNWNITEINELKENFSKDDLSDIFSYKNKYLEYRTILKGENFFELSFFFDELDKILKTLFDFFKETEENEFKPFENEAIKINDISEDLQLFNNGFKKFSFSSYSIPNQQAETKSLLEQPIKQKIKPGRPKAKYKPLQNYIIENPVYKSPKEISTILIEQFKNSKAADLKTMIEGLKRLNIWNKSDNKEIVLMLKKDFNYKESTENYRKAKSKKVDEVKIQIKKLITK